MADPSTTARPDKRPQPAANEANRDARRAAALRANLRRRKLAGVEEAKERG